ncbi:hypothetical protein C8Q74DRAFT_1221956 [Fomes fomentarius]|nr:hypothetical protein C8Q74DRAFT_1221956 [Fomes fomentarius]
MLHSESLVLVCAELTMVSELSHQCIDTGSSITISLIKPHNIPSTPLGTMISLRNTRDTNALTDVVADGVRSSSAAGASILGASQDQSAQHTQSMGWHHAILSLSVTTSDPVFRDLAILVKVRPQTTTSRLFFKATFKFEPSRRRTADGPTLASRTRHLNTRQCGGLHA